MKNGRGHGAQFIIIGLLLWSGVALGAVQFIHRAVQIGFPETAAGFSRGKVTKYDAAGEDVSIGYDRHVSGHEIAATIYIYPRLRGDAELDALLEEFRSVHPTLSKVTKSPVSARLGARKLNGRALRFNFDEDLDGHVVTVRGAVWLFRQGAYWVKVRFSGRLDQAGESDEAVQALLAGLIWKSGV